MLYLLISIREKRTLRKSQAGSQTELLSSLWLPLFLLEGKRWRAVAPVVVQGWLCFVS